MSLFHNAVKIFGIRIELRCDDKKLLQYVLVNYAFAYQIFAWQAGA